MNKNENVLMNNTNIINTSKKLNSSIINNNNIFINKNTIYPNANCVYHKGFYITNFCKNQECLMPLCPECVKIHTVEHREKYSYAEFDTIENIIENCLLDFKNLKKLFSENRKNLDIFHRKFENIDKLLYKELEVAKENMIEIIDELFERFYKELKDKVLKNKKNLDLELVIATQKINEKYSNVYILLFFLFNF